MHSTGKLILSQMLFCVYILQLEMGHTGAATPLDGVMVVVSVFVFVGRGWEFDGLGWLVYVCVWGGTIDVVNELRFLGRGSFRHSEHCNFGIGH